MYQIEQIRTLLKDYPEYRYKQVYKFLFHDLISNWSEATSLPKELINLLQEFLTIIGENSISLKQSFDKNTEKILITLEDGQKIESVLMKMVSVKGKSTKDQNDKIVTQKSRTRNTVCVSTQVGCAMGCAFCATGKLGIKRNLTDLEIVNQVLIFGRQLKKNNDKVTNVVFMGMGEPFENYENVISAVKILNDNEGLNIGSRKISISTCGIVPQIYKFADEELQVNLAISLHSANQEKREKFMPIAYKYNLEDLMKSIDYYIEKTNRKVMFEYILLNGINDTENDARELANLLYGKLCMVNLINYNDTGEFQPSLNNDILRFKNILLQGGIEVTQRYRFGHDIKASCGQLAGK